MGINCHIAIHVPDGDNICLLNAADVRWLSRDQDLRETLGIPDLVANGFWEHENNEDYQRVLDAALVHQQVLIVERDRLHELDFGTEPHSGPRLLRLCQRDLDRTEEWIAYYELASTLVRLNHEVMCYGR